MANLQHRPMADFTNISKRLTLSFDFCSLSSQEDTKFFFLHKICAWRIYMWQWDNKLRSWNYNAYAWFTILYLCSICDIWYLKILIKANNTNLCFQKRTWFNRKCKFWVFTFTEKNTSYFQTTMKYNYFPSRDSIFKPKCKRNFINSRTRYNNNNKFTHICGLLVSHCHIKLHRAHIILTCAHIMFIMLLDIWCNLVYTE